MSIILLMTMGICGCSATVPETVEEDGGVNNYNSGADSPKAIKSTDITHFECEFSLIQAVSELESELDGRVYTLYATYENNTVKCKAEWYDTYGEGAKNEFDADAGVMAKLQETVSKYDFAQYNGYSNKTNGLPDMYGAVIDISYKSGESIYAYDNEDCFVPFEAIKELVDLFYDR